MAIDPKAAQEWLDHPVTRHAIAKLERDLIEGHTTTGEAEYQNGVYEGIRRARRAVLDIGKEKQPTRLGQPRYGAEEHE